MRNNGPLTNKEVELGDSDLLVSRTNANGIITFANKNFVDISAVSYTHLTLPTNREV